MPLATDVAIELEPLKTPETPTPTPAFLVLLPSSLDPLSEERHNTIHVQVSLNPFAILLVLQKRGRGNSTITPERLRFSRLALLT